MMRMMSAAALLTTLAAVPALAQEAEPQWFARVGASRLSLADGLRLDGLS